MFADNVVLMVDHINKRGNHMTDTEKRIAIAEACPELFRWNAASSRVEWVDTDEEVDPLGDLNAMHEAEECLSAAESINFVEALEHFRTHKNHATLGRFYLVHATCPQRADAFLKAIGTL